MSEFPERTLPETIDRLNRQYDEELKDCELELQSWEDEDRYRVYIRPENPEEHDHDFRTQLGEAFSKKEMDAFLRGIELADDIPVKAEYKD